MREHFFIFLLISQKGKVRLKLTRSGSSQSETEKEIGQHYNALDKVIPTDEKAALDHEHYMRAMNEFTEESEDIIPQLEEQIDQLHEEAEYEDEVAAAKNARQVVDAINISTRELRAVTTHQKNKRRTFARPIASDAKESVLATVNGVRNLLKSLKGIEPKKRRNLERAVEHFERAIFRLAESMQPEPNTTRKLKRMKFDSY